MLHEGMLADEFGVSRTPVRQALQKLAYEHLVETRTGVGTVLSPMLPGQRGECERVLRALLQAAADCAQGRVLSSGLRRRLEDSAAPEAIPDETGEQFFRAHAALLDLTTSLVDDRILRDALRASQWRWVRWRMSDRVAAPLEAHRDLALTFERLRPCTTDRAVFETLARAPL